MRILLLAFALATVACRPQAEPVVTSWLAADLAERRFDLSTAAGFFQRALEAGPDNREVRSRLLRLRIAEGDEARSLELARSLEPTDMALPMLRLAVDAVKRADWPEARRRLEGLGAAGSQGVIRHLGLAWIHNETGATGDVAPALDLAGNIRGAANWAALHRAWLHHAAGRRDAARDAMAALEPVIRDANSVLALIALHVRSDAPERARSLARRHRGGRWPLLVTALEDLREPPASPVRGLAEAFYQLALGLERRNPPATLIHARLARMLDPDHEAALLLVGRVHAARGQYRDALAVYDGLDAESVWRPAAEIYRSNALDGLDLTDEAAALLEDAAKSRPEDVRPLYQLGSLLQRHERYEEAFEAYDRAIARIPGEPAPEHWTLFYGRGVAAERAKRWEAAERDLLQALEFAPDHPDLLNYLGYSWIDRGENYERAEEMVSKAATLAPQSGHIVDSLGWVYFRTGRYDRAVTELERAVALEPLDPIINEHLGDAYWKVGRELEAGYQWRRALEFDPEPDRVEALARRLDCGLDCGPAVETGKF